MEYWIVTYEIEKVDRYLRHNGFNCASMHEDKTIERKTIPIKGSISSWLANSSGSPAILYSKEITIKEFKNLTKT